MGQVKLLRHDQGYFYNQVIFLLVCNVLYVPNASQSNANVLEDYPFK